MLDETTRAMLDAALSLTPDELGHLHAHAAGVKAADYGDPVAEAPEAAMSIRAGVQSEPVESGEGADAYGACETEFDADGMAGPALGGSSSRGRYERTRTRESKVSTTCLGKPRSKHEWWPVGTVLTGRIGSETFGARVVENPAVKSGRSLVITSGAATGQVCITPTRAALLATEDYRQARGIGRAGGVTNGWTFWKPAIM